VDSDKSEDSAFDCCIPPDLLLGIHRGLKNTTYRGVPVWKAPFDLVLYSMLIDKLKPKSIIELGSAAGGSALWFADQMQVRGLPCKIVSINYKLCPMKDGRINFVQGDVLCMDKVSTDWSILPHPWLVVEDSAHTYEACSSVLNFFDPLLVEGDYIVVEDGIVEKMPRPKYRKLRDNGPFHAVRDFLKSTKSTYSIDRNLCDFYGKNATWSPEGWLRKGGSRGL